MKFNIGSVALALALIFSFESTAGVKSIIDSSYHTKRESSRNNYKPTTNSCVNLGYNLTYCKSGEQGVGFCPSNKSYFKYCCPTGYTHSSKECKNMGLSVSRDSCHGYYACVSNDDY